MQGFITELSTYAQDGSLAKAATDLQSIAAAVNSIEISKADALGNMFKGAGDLSRNNEAYKHLAKAVEEIRDMMADNGGGGGGGGGGVLPAIGDALGLGDKKQSSGDSKMFSKLNSTLAGLNTTMQSLPGAIRSIKIVVEDS